MTPTLNTLDRFPPEPNIRATMPSNAKSVPGAHRNGTVAPGFLARLLNVPSWTLYDALHQHVQTVDRDLTVRVATAEREVIEARAAIAEERAELLQLKQAVHSELGRLNRRRRELMKDDPEEAPDLRLATDERQRFGA